MEIKCKCLNTSNKEKQRNFGYVLGCKMNAKESGICYLHEQHILKFWGNKSKRFRFFNEKLNLEIEDLGIITESILDIENSDFNFLKYATEIIEHLGKEIEPKLFQEKMFLKYHFPLTLISCESYLESL